MRGIQFRRTKGNSCESVDVLETENVSAWGGGGGGGGLELLTFGFMPNVLTTSANRARHLLSHVCEYWLRRYRYFCSKVNTWNDNCARATSLIFVVTYRCSCERVEILEIDNVPKWGRLELSIFGFMPNALTTWAIKARHLLSHGFEYRLWRYRTCSHISSKMWDGITCAFPNFNSAATQLTIPCRRCE